jgi:ribonuclease E
MTKRMLIDATHEEETRVAIMDGRRLLEFDYESKFRKPLKGSIFLAKVTRVEPSLQAAFVNFGGNRHGFLPFSEIHPDYFRIPIADREALLAEQAAALEAHQDEDREDEEQSGAGDTSENNEGEYSDPEDAEQPDSNHAQEAGDDDEDSDDEEDHDRDVVEEVGGATGLIGGDDPDHQIVHGVHADNAAAVPEATYRETDEFSIEVVENDTARNDEYTPAPAFDPETGEPILANSDQSPSEENTQSGYERGEGRRDRFRRGRGGRRKGPGRAFKSRQVESFGGDEYEDDGRFRFNLRRKYKIQEVIKRGQIMLVQISKEERGNKGAAVSTYLSLPGRYCVLMPNSPRGGGVSRKIASFADRARMREMLKDMDVPQGMSVIVRTAGVARSQPELKRDLDYLMRLWDNIRELTLQSSAPAMVYEEADLIKRAVRDLYGPDLNEIVVSGEEGYKNALNFMKLMIPSHADRVIEYADHDMLLFNKYHAESQIAEIGESQVTLPSGGYLVINQTEALVAIDVNSGKATKERHIEETALKTNLEAADEAARQLRLRDLGGLVVVDFIDMEDRRNNAKVERRMRDALSSDRARIQMGRISSFGLMELSRQRLNPSLTESQFEVCGHCKGVGRVRTADANSLMVLRAIEEEGIKRRAAQLVVHVSADIAIYILNNKRSNLNDIETRHGISVSMRVDPSIGASYRIEVLRSSSDSDTLRQPARPNTQHEASRSAYDHMANEDMPPEDHEPEDDISSDGAQPAPRDTGGDAFNREERGGRRRGRRGGRGRARNGRDFAEGAPAVNSENMDTGYEPAMPSAEATPYNSSFDPQSEEDPDDYKFNREGAAEGLHAGSSLQEFSQKPRGGRGRGQGQGRARQAGTTGRGGRLGPREGGREGGRGRQGGRDIKDAPPVLDSGYAPRQALRKDSNFAEKNDSSAQMTQPTAIKPTEPVIPKTQPRRVPEPVSQEPKPYEKVNEPPPEKKRGWWNRLMD